MSKTPRELLFEAVFFIVLLSVFLTALFWEDISFYFYDEAKDEVLKCIRTGKPVIECQK